MVRGGQLLIANGAALSNSLDLGDSDMLVGLVIPAAWTAAALTFQADPDGDGTFNNVYDEAGTELTIASANVAVGRYLLLNATTFGKLAGTIKIRSGVAATPVNQAADRTLQVVLAKRWI